MLLGLSGVWRKTISGLGLPSLTNLLQDKFLAPFVLIGKKILQKMYREGASWDEPLSDHLLVRWSKWKQSLTYLTKIKLSRCTRPPEFDIVDKQELHHFSDASNSRYGRCSYLRLVSTTGRVHCALLFAKSRVSSLKQITIPRAELQAAVTSMQVLQLLQTELRFSETKHFFWTDSKVVLGYVNNDVKRFHVFMANRLQEIHDVSS